MAATKKVNWEQQLAKLDASKHAETILQWLADAKWPGAAAAPAWEAMFAKLIELADPATVEPLRAMANELPGFLGVKHRVWMTEHLESTAVALAKKEGKPTRAIAVKRLGTSADAMTIVQKVFDAPDDHELRRVVADQLLELGDPWGEFIHLGFVNEATPEQKALAEALLKKNAQTFAGPIAKITKLDGREFEKGFLRRVLTSMQMVPRQAAEAAVRSPYWSTVHRLEIDMADAPKWFVPELLKNPALRRVREFTFNRYYEPLISLSRADASAPWCVVEVKNVGEGWLKYFRGFLGALPPEERARVEVGDVTHRGVIRGVIEDAKGAALAATKRRGAALG